MATTETAVGYYIRKSWIESSWQEPGRWEYFAIYASGHEVPRTRADSADAVRAVMATWYADARELEEAR